MRYNIKFTFIFMFFVFMIYLDFNQDVSKQLIKTTYNNMYSTNNTTLSDKIYRANEIYLKLSKFTGIYYGNLPEFTVINSKNINAYTDYNNWKISVTTGLLHFVKSDSELASVIGHEIGHIILQHDIINMYDKKTPHSLLEDNADKFGIYLMLRAGYDVCQAKTLWERHAYREGDWEIGKKYPSYSYRIWQLNFPKCSNQ